MTRIICAKCKNAFLQKADGNLTCPSCEAVFSEKDENLLTGIQYYKEGNCDGASDCLMKYIVQEGAEPRAMFVKALCDASEYDEDTYSLKELYEKLLEALGEISDRCFVEYLTMANDEVCKIEKAVAEKHIALFEDADAEKIKKEVTTIITLQNDAKEYRNKLTDLACEYNNRAENTISVSFSDCFLVEPEIAEEVGNRKYEKIINNIAAHTVFTGSLSTDIKNLEIYYRCIVMFFRKNRQKYDFLMASSEKFTELSKRLEEGQYNTIKGTSTIGDKLRSAAYDFFQETLKEHDDDEKMIQTESVIVNEPEVIEISEEPVEDVSEKEPEITEFEDISSSTIDETEDDDASESLDDDTTDIIEIATDDEEEEVSEDVAEVLSEEDIDEETVEIVPEEESTNTVEETAEDEQEEASEEESESESEEVSSAPSITATLTKIDKTMVDVIPDDEQDEEETTVETEKESEEVTESTEKVVRKHKTHIAPFVAILAIIILIGAIVAIKTIPPKLKADKYAQAAEYVEQEKYAEAAALYSELGDYEDSKKLYLESTYSHATKLENEGKYLEAKAVYEKIVDYKNSDTKVKFCIYSDALAKLNEGKFDDAKKAFDSIPDYSDAAAQSSKCMYKKAESLIADKKYVEAVNILDDIPSDENVDKMILDAQYAYVKAQLDLKIVDETTEVYLANLVMAGVEGSTDLAEYAALLKSGADVPAPEETPVPDDTPAESTVVIFTNTSKSDSETNTTEFDSDRAIYIHIDCLDESLYGQKLSMTYENKYSKATLKSNTFTEDAPSYVFTYGGDGTSNYDITFRLVDATGNVVAEQTVSVK